jgi:hypothetical protein
MEALMSTDEALMRAFYRPMGGGGEMLSTNRFIIVVQQALATWCQVL